MFLLLLATALLACDREMSRQKDAAKNAPARPAGSPQTQPVMDNRRTMNPVAPPQADLPANRIPGAAEPQQRVELTEYEIRMPATLRAGEVEFFIVNAGKENHSFVIEGEGLSMALPEPLTRGNNATIEIALDPGTYTVHCPVAGHAGKGMKRTITVQK